MQQRHLVHDPQTHLAGKTANIALTIIIIIGLQDLSILIGFCLQFMLSGCSCINIHKRMNPDYRIITVMYWNNIKSEYMYIMAASLRQINHFEGKHNCHRQFHTAINNCHNCLVDRDFYWKYGLNDQLFILNEAFLLLVDSEKLLPW